MVDGALSLGSVVLGGEWTTGVVPETVTCEKMFCIHCYDAIQMLPDYRENRTKSFTQLLKKEVTPQQSKTLKPFLKTCLLSTRCVCRTCVTT